MVAPALEKLAAPWMERRVPGLVVPMPTLPVLCTTKFAPVYIIPPPVRVSPFEEEKLNAEIPPENVDVAVVVAMMPGTVEVPYEVRFPANTPAP